LSFLNKQSDHEVVLLQAEDEQALRRTDLGYYMGYRIAESYCEHAGDKLQAIADILRISDGDAFVRASRYADRFAAQ